jgi:Kef-type K+ transport system membrane component KefB
MEFLLALLILLLLAKVFGEALHYIGLSSLIGEVAVGIVLGPALLGWIIITPGDPTSEAIRGVALLGLIVLMLVAGMNSRFDMLMKVKFKAFVIAISGFATTFTIGFGISYAWSQQFLTSLFVAAVLSNTATEIVIRFTEHSPFRDLMVGAALIDDIFAVYVLGILSTATLSQTSGHPLDFSVFIWSTIGIVAFFILVVFLSRELVVKRNIMRRLWKFEQRGIPLTFAIILALVLATVAQRIGLHAIIGAYMAGLFIGRLRERPMVTLQSRIRLNTMLESITTSLQSILTPMFFVFVGLSFSINPGQINLVLLLALTIAAFGGKLLGCGAGAAAVGYKGRDLAEIGTAMCARGSLELAILQFGLLSGVVDSGLFAVMVMTALITTILTPILYKYVTRK